MKGHIRALAILYIVSAILGLACGAMVLAVIPFVGRLTPEQIDLIRVYALTDADIKPLVLHYVWPVGLFFIVTSIPQLVGGIALLRPKPWGRVLGFVLGAINLVSFPIGTVLGVYTFWALLRPGVAEWFRSGGELRVERAGGSVGHRASD